MRILNLIKCYFKGLYVPTMLQWLRKYLIKSTVVDFSVDNNGGHDYFSDHGRYLL